jgi:bacillithiol biosynthesis cysteine-adding enzyme BshC
MNFNHQRRYTLINTNIHFAEYQDVKAFSSFDKAYQAQDDRLARYLKAFPSLDSINKAIQERQFPQERRAILVETLERQYKTIGLWDSAAIKIKSIGDPSTFTVITAHQPVLFGGPLYMIYKIASVIHLARQLNSGNSSQKVVPIFVVGGEDHDVEEMNHALVFNNRLEWKTDQEGSVGRFRIDDAFNNVVGELAEITGERGDKVVSLIRSCFSDDLSYGEGYQKFIYSLFSHTPLLVVNMDDAAFKQSFIPIIEKEIFEMPSQSLVEATQDALEGDDFKKQAYAREINLFHLGDKGRTQINPDGSNFEIAGKVYSPEMIRELIHNEPENFSPNVVVRPLYQEWTLPNVAYIGGGGELAYWTERKSQFSAFGIPFPILIRRASIGWLDSHVVKKMEKVGMTIDDLFEDEEEYIKASISETTEEDDLVREQKAKINASFDLIRKKMESFDPSIEKYVAAEQRKTEKILENIETKIIRSAKKKEEVTVNQIRKVYDHLFPGQSLQERVSNFIPYYMKYGQDWIDHVIEHADPMDRRFFLFVEN